MAPVPLSWRFRTSALVVLGLLLGGLVVVTAGCGTGERSETNGENEAAEIDSLPAFVTLTPEQLENVEIRTAVVERHAVGEPLDLPGRVVAVPDQVALVTSLVAGRIEAVSVNTGDRVQAGQPVVRIASPQLGALVADLQRARTELNLQQRLNDRGVGTPKQLADARTAYAAVRQHLRSIGVAPERIDALATGAESAGSLPLVAPISGVVLERTATQGGPVTSGETLLRIVDPTPILVEADAYESELHRLRKGLPVEIRLPTDTLTRHGSIDQIVPEVESTRRTAVVRIRLPNEDRMLKPGMFATAHVEAFGNRRPSVPARSIQRQGDQSFVLVAENDSTFRRRNVSVSDEASGAALVAVPDALLGARVVTEGALQITSVMTGIEADED